MADPAVQQALVGGEQLPKSSETHALQRADGKVRLAKLDGDRVTVRIARDLAQHEIATACRGQYQRRAQLRPGQIRERKADEDYCAGCR